MLSKKLRNHLAARLRKTGSIPIYEVSYQHSYGGDSSTMVPLCISVDFREALAAFNAQPIGYGDFDEIVSVQITRISNGKRAVIKDKDHTNAVRENWGSPCEDYEPYYNDYDNEYDLDYEREMAEREELYSGLEQDSLRLLQVLEESAGDYFSQQEFEVFEGVYDMLPSEELADITERKGLLFNRQWYKVDFSIGREFTDAMTREDFGNFYRLFFTISNIRKVDFVDRTPNVRTHILYFEWRSQKAYMIRPWYLREEDLPVINEQQAQDLIYLT